MRFDTPAWRVAGSAAAWLLFSFSFTVLALSLFGVLQIGGSCADGGPYVIAVHCPENSGLFTLIGTYGGVASVFVALLFARGFGTRIILAWTVLFLAMSLPFVIVGAVTLPEGIPFLLGGLLFVAMALAPLVIDARAAGLQRTFLGLTDRHGRRFREREGARPSMFVPADRTPGELVAPTATDWALSLGIWLGGSAAGAVLGLLVFSAS